ncbi:unnamed protein product [Blepharisma stoltei]|uniref:Uncharacterized protein n=1 Tax=Blepharisma stoltei TaxID=1481888 RepID=A0AAU9J612_9CILI|nr:unnamed protein product [Blepharisma stoltei]
MGCCNSELRRQKYLHITQKVRESIERNNARGLKEFIHMTDTNSKSSESSMIDEPIITIKGISLNALAYALYLGKADVFKHLCSKMGASIQEMCSLLERQKINALEFICQKGHTEILECFLPYYLSMNKETVIVQEESITINFNTNQAMETPQLITYTAIHMACEQGHINLISYVYNYFKTSPYCPYQLDIDFQDDFTGENCALISCRNGNYAMMKFLNESCHANFRVLNKRNENAIQVAAAGSKKKPTAAFLECFSYLTENIGIDITYMHEETLLLLEDRNLIKYVEKQLQNRGINVTKTQIEKRNKIVKPHIPKTLEELKLDREFEDNFDLRKCLENEDRARQSMMSSINPLDSNIETPFMSTNEFSPQG